MPEQIVGVVNPDGSLVGTGPVSGSVAVTNFPATQPVSGTVTTVPSGTQTVSGSVTTTPSGTQNVAITGQPISTGIVTTVTTPVLSADVPDPSVPGLYSYVLFDAPGVVAANNFLSLFNPIGSGKNLMVYTAAISTYVASGTSNTRDSLLISRVTTASAGTLAGAATIAKAKTSAPAPIAEVRTGNPTVTLGANLTAYSPPIATNTQGSPDEVIAAPAAVVLLVPGEGIVLRTTVGNVSQTWNITLVWGEG